MERTPATIGSFRDHSCDIASKSALTSIKGWFAAFNRPQGRSASSRPNLATRNRCHEPGRPAARMPSTKTVTFRQPFWLKGIDRLLQPADHRVVTDEELIEGKDQARDWRRIQEVFRNDHGGCSPIRMCHGKPKIPMSARTTPRPVGGPTSTGLPRSMGSSSAQSPHRTRCASWSSL
jgi:hypothetical protein